jgi:hypothetical protein
VLATVMMVVMVLAVIVSGRIVGAILCRRRSGTAESHGQGHCKGRTDTGNEFHFCLLLTNAVRDRVHRASY